MPFEIVRNDITNMAVDAIVNTANPKPVIGAGVDSQIHEKAGPQLLDARKRIGRILPGQSAITPGYGLQAKYVIHTVGPVWRGGLFGETRLLYCCYTSALRLAADNGCQSVAFPLISSGNYGFPKDKALQIAISAVTEFLTGYEMMIYLVVFDQTSFHLSGQLFHNIASYIDQHYVDTQRRTFSSTAVIRNRYEDACCQESEVLEKPGIPHPPRAAQMCASAPMAAPKMSLEEMLRQEDAGFTETLLRLIDKSGKKDSEIYKRANLSKQHFSKIRNNPTYKPTKPTAIALALALELDLPTTRDLIGRAGFALTNSSKFDLIIRYFIEQGNYNIVQINMALYEFDQSLLGV